MNGELHMINALRTLWRDRRGNAILIAAGALPLIIGSAGLATDTIQWTLWKRQLQRAADSAALAGVYQRTTANTQSAVETAVCNDLAKNQRTGIQLTGTYVTCADGTTRRGPVMLLADSGVQKLPVHVNLSISRPLAFSGLFLTSPPVITASSTAATVPAHDQYCVISLETSATKTGITGTGNSAVEMDCGMITNSPATNSAAANGSSRMIASVIASVGGIQQSNNWQVGKYDPYISAMTDPYAGVNPPTDQKCARQGNRAVALDENTDLSTVTDGTTTGFSNGVNCFSSLSVGSNRSLTLPAGVYYINGGDVNIQGTITGTDVTIILTNSDTTATSPTIGNFKMNAGAVANLSAPATGPYAGIAVYQDRRAQDTNGANSPNTVNGNSASVITGALYFPKQQLGYNGTGTLTAICTRFVTRRIVFSGNNTTSNKFARDCTGGGNPPYEGGRLVRLVA